MHTATIYCKPYIAYWLNLYYGNPVKLPRESNFRATILACLGKEYYPHSDYNKALYPARVDLRLNKDLIKEVGHSLSLSCQHMINEVLSEKIGAEIYLFITAYCEAGHTITEAVIAYQEHLGVPEKIFPADTIRTKYFRYKRNLKKHFSSQLKLKLNDRRNNKRL